MKAHEDKSIAQIDLNLIRVGGPTENVLLMECNRRGLALWLTNGLFTASASSVLDVLVDNISGRAGC